MNTVECVQSKKACFKAAGQSEETDETDEEKQKERE
jgi:hypothetical protein